MTDETPVSSAVSAGPEPPARPAPSPSPAGDPGDPAHAGDPAPAAAAALSPPPAWLQRWEIAAVLLVSLGASALYALLSFIGSVTAKQALSKQTTTLNGSL
ncbi:MAG TPA: hypothetical protein VMK84_24530, partial [Streptosporangiaceae bacterium]|nr:hypothetical protein [Streptosporangiaceae bacterium]